MIPELTREQRQAIDEHQGQPIVVVDADRQKRYLLIAETDFRVRGVLTDSDDDGDWNDEKESRRRDLIDKDIAGTITADERSELALLDRQGNAHYDKIAPRPIEGARRLHQELLNKRVNP